VTCVFVKHDDSEPDCVPSTSSHFTEAGNYLMFAFARTGDQTNNKLFSPCSLRNMTLVKRPRTQHILHLCLIGMFCESVSSASETKCLVNTFLSNIFYNLLHYFSNHTIHRKLFKHSILNTSSLIDLVGGK